MILGTAAYMAPEQARGRPVDKRADIWAFGCVLYEMLTGTRAFGGDDVSDMLASVLAREPDWRRTAAGDVANPADVLRRCLHKDLRQRVGDIRDMRLALEGAFDTPGTPAPAAAAKYRWATRTLPWGTAAALAVGLIATLVLWAPWRTPQQDRPLVRLSVDLGPDAERDVRVSAVLSPDGSRIVYTTKGPNGRHRLYTRRLDQPTATLLTPEAVRQASPVFSPDGEWVTYWAPIRSKLMKVPAQGGEPVVIGATPGTFREQAGATTTTSSWAATMACGAFPRAAALLRS